MNRREALKSLGAGILGFFTGMPLLKSDPVPEWKPGDLFYPCDVSQGFSLPRFVRHVITRHGSNNTCTMTLEGSADGERFYPIPEDETSYLLNGNDEREGIQIIHSAENA